MTPYVSTFNLIFDGNLYSFTKGKKKQEIKKRINTQRASNIGEDKLSPLPF